MHKVWLERALPAEHAHLFSGVAALLGPGTATPDDPLVAIGGAEGIVAASKVRYNAVLFARAPHLRAICRTGIGYDNIAVDEATAHGIAVCNVPDGPTVSTAEHAIALLFAVAKNLAPATAALRAPDRFDFFTHFTGVELAGLQIGLVGLGRIGRRVAAMTRAIGMRVVAFDPFVDAAAAMAAQVEMAPSLETLLATSDVISLHLPLTADNRRLLNRERLAIMKPGAILINTARGGLVDEQALCEALDSGHVWGAGLDVFDPEPPPSDHPLVRHARVVATPHTAGATAACKKRIWEGAIRQVLEVLDGKRPAHLVNPEVWPRPIERRPGR
ncbi:MAG: hydroxyacid dehydrogenase [Planctomycetia bacterium]|nr:hydroxyacid dehydrogenase [Planctomycetia bacterium]